MRFYPRAIAAALVSDFIPDLGVVSNDDYGRDGLAEEYVAPRNRTERIIAKVVSRALSIRQVGVADDFFELGGDSIVGAAILNRINQIFGTQLSFEDAIEAFTIERLARLINERSTEPAEYGVSAPKLA